MKTAPKYFIVEASALPKVFLKVAEAKRLLETGAAETVNDAAARSGISRSAFYKYKDAVRPFQDMGRERIITFSLSLRDEPGMLSRVLDTFASCGGNIKTINQGIPGNGSATVSIAAEVSGLIPTFEDFTARLSGLSGVLRCDIVAG